MTTLTIPDGYMADDKGRLVPTNTIKPERLLEDETVAKVLGYADDLSAQIARFRQHTLDDVDVFNGILEQQYNAKPRGGAKGNVTLTSFDGCKRITIAQADIQDFGAELQIAKTIFDEVIADLAGDIDPNIKSLVERAFEVGKKGRINREHLLKVRDLDIAHPKWGDFQNAVNNSIRTIASKTYVRIHRRDTPQDKWQNIPIDIANA